MTRGLGRVRHMDRCALRARARVMDSGQDPLQGSGRGRIRRTVRVIITGRRMVRQG